MSHHIYNSAAIVIGSRKVRERDKVFLLLTRDLGLIYATAQGIRRESSKLGGVLLDFAIISVSLVKGKHAWRITTASLLTDTASELRTRKESLKSIARVLNLVERLVRGEEKHKELFVEVENATLFLIEEGREMGNGWEIVAVLRILYHLGYVSAQEVEKEFLEGEMTAELIERAQSEKKKLVALINSGIKESGLA